MYVFEMQDQYDDDECNTLILVDKQIDDDTREEIEWNLDVMRKLDEWQMTDVYDIAKEVLVKNGYVVFNAGYDRIFF